LSSIAAVLKVFGEHFEDVKTDQGAVSAADRELTAELPVSTSGEVLIYLGVVPPNSVSSHTSFKVETAIR
jgi:hypothetical protein